MVLLALIHFLLAFLVEVSETNAIDYHDWLLITSSPRTVLASRSHNLPQSERNPALVWPATHTSPVWKTWYWDAQRRSGLAARKSGVRLKSQDTPFTLIISLAGDQIKRHRSWRQQCGKQKRFLSFTVKPQERSHQEDEFIFNFRPTLKSGSWSDCFQDLTFTSLFRQLFYSLFFSFQSILYNITSHALIKSQDASQKHIQDDSHNQICKESNTRSHYQIPAIVIVILLQSIIDLFISPTIRFIFQIANRRIRLIDCLIGELFRNIDIARR